jgi:hypothetical protein
MACLGRTPTIGPTQIETNNQSATTRFFLLPFFFKPKLVVHLVSRHGWSEISCGSFRNNIKQPDL